MMRGGGVCWLSTAIWRAALGAGLKTEYRENHVGLVDALGAGLDATNTLVLRNDSDVPVTIHAWIERDQVYAALDSDEPLGRTAVVRAPQRLGPGRYVAYQEIYWDDGSVTTNEFDSRYAW
jgi:vancomycin resistance protein YoaR